jgi:hypothetical protein
MQGGKVMPASHQVEKPEAKGGAVIKPMSAVAPAGREAVSVSVTREAVPVRREPVPVSMSPAPASTQVPQQVQIPQPVLVPPPVQMQSQATVEPPPRPTLVRKLQQAWGSNGQASAPVPTAVQAPAPASMGGFNEQQVLAVLRDSVYPDQREWAACQLAAADWRTSPHVVQALLNAAGKDSAATVRVECVRSLSKMEVSTAPVIAGLEALRSDRDPRVQHEAEQALNKLTAGRSVARGGIQQTGGSTGSTYVQPTGTGMSGGYR